MAPRGRDNANNAPLGVRGGGGAGAGATKEQLGLRWLVVDECDRLMDLGFEEQMRGILEDLEKRSPSTTASYNSGGGGGKKRRRTILCSATASEGVDRLAGLIMGEEGASPAVVGAREDVKVREPVRRDLTVVSGADKGKKRAAEDDDEEEEEDPATEVQGSTSTKGQLELPSGFTPPSQLLHHYLVVPPKLRFVSLIALLRKLLVKSRSSGGMKILVFMSCTDAVDFWWKALGGMKLGRDGEEEEEEDFDKEEEEEESGPNKKKSLASLHPLLPSIPVYRLHGSLPLQTRLASLSAFSTKYKIEEGKREGEETEDAVLLCTSVAARGLDVKNVGCVVQVDAPTEVRIIPATLLELSLVQPSTDPARFV
jgi:ATP-dependent RNA helicase DDX31/DBP7